MWSISKKVSPARTQLNNNGVTSKRLVKHPTHMLFYNILTLPRLQQSDRGTYTCHVSSGENAKQKQVDVTVYGGEPRRAAASPLSFPNCDSFLLPFQIDRSSASSPDTGLSSKCRRDRKLSGSHPNCERSRHLKSPGKNLLPSCQFSPPFL